MVCMVGFFNKDDEGGNYGTAEKEGDTSAGNTRTDEQTSKSNQTQERQTADSIVGIDGLMDKRVKLEESINYVGHMIKIKDHRWIMPKPNSHIILIQYMSTYGFKGNYLRRCWNSNDGGWCANCPVFAPV